MKARMKMVNKLTRDIIEKAIKKWRVTNPGQQNKCETLHKHYCLCTCLACQLDQALADFERAGDRLSELYFEAKSEILK